jgi:myo-inositol-1-phosphate synthase
VSTGLWLIGARGSVATTAVLGLAALARGHAGPEGCVTAGWPGLEDWDRIVVGGHDVSDVSLAKRAETLVDAGMIPAALLAATRDDLELADAEIRPGYAALPPGRSQQQEAERLAADLIDFRERHGLSRVVVIDLSSTEPPHDLPDFSVEAIAEPDREVLPPSAVMAWAALLAGSPYAGFTPSTGMRPLLDLAREAGVPVAGQDGKTGQTWLRTVLAPAFTDRGLRVLSWAGANLLGGGDGATLADPAAVRSKLASKTRGLRDLTGSDVTPLHIDNVPDLGDVKVAWDHVHVQGFLGSRITLQTTWSAYDSMLAAPMVLDLTRLLALADRAGLAGVVPELGFFFKDPWGSDRHGAADQAAALRAWAVRTAAAL